MKVKIIALLLWVIIGWWMFIYQQFSDKEKYKNEVAAVNKKIHEQIIEASSNIPESLIVQTKQEIIDILKREEHVIIKDYFYSFENFYNALLKHEKYGELIKSKDFEGTEEYKIIEKLKTLTLVSEIVQNGERRTIVWVPQNIDCSQYELKAPCIKSNEETDIDKVDFVFVKNDYSTDWVERILNGELKLFF